MELSSWLDAVLRMFGSTLSAVLLQPVLRVFAVLLVFLIVVALFAHLVRQGRRER